jgi:carbohydrate-selective porin OprB
MRKALGIKGPASQQLSDHNTGRMRAITLGINTIAAIEAVQTTRLSELWMEQKFWDGAASTGGNHRRRGVLYSDVGALFWRTTGRRSRR